MRFQKSIRIAPGIRINLSKSGVGVSVGPKGLKVGVDGKGRRYSSVGIPGTGISQRSYQKAGKDGHTPEEYQRALIIGVLIGIGNRLQLGPTALRGESRWRGSRCMISVFGLRG